jgi:hypothetical protein
VISQTLLFTRISGVKFRDFSITFWRNLENLFFILADLIFGPLNKFSSNFHEKAHFWSACICLGHLVVSFCDFSPEQKMSYQSSDKCHMDRTTKTAAKTLLHPTTTQKKCNSSPRTTSLLPVRRVSVHNARGVVGAGVSREICRLASVGRSSTILTSAGVCVDPETIDSADEKDTLELRERALDIHLSLLQNVLRPAALSSDDPSRIVGVIPPDQPPVVSNPDKMWGILQLELATGARVAVEGGVKWRPFVHAHPAQLEMEELCVTTSSPVNESGQSSLRHNFFPFHSADFRAVVPNATPEANLLGRTQEECNVLDVAMWNVAMSNVSGAIGGSEGESKMFTAPTAEELPCSKNPCPLVYVHVPCSAVSSCIETVLDQNADNTGGDGCVEASLAFRRVLLCEVQRRFAHDLAFATLACETRWVCLLVTWRTSSFSTPDRSSRDTSDRFWDYIMVPAPPQQILLHLHDHLRGWWDTCVRDWFMLPDDATQEDAQKTNLGAYTMAIKKVQG